MIDWEKLARANTHPTQIAALDMFDQSTEPLSPVQIAKALDKSVGEVGYAVLRLKQRGFLELHSERPVRGAVEHFYVVKAAA